MFEIIGIMFVAACAIIGFSLLALWALARYEYTANWVIKKAYHNLVFNLDDASFNMFLNRLKKTREEGIKK